MYAEQILLTSTSLSERVFGVYKSDRCLMKDHVEWRQLRAMPPLGVKILRKRKQQGHQLQRDRFCWHAPHSRDREMIFPIIWAGFFAEPLVMVMIEARLMRVFRYAWSLIKSYNGAPTSKADTGSSQVSLCNKLRWHTPQSMASCSVNFSPVAPLWSRCRAKVVSLEDALWLVIRLQ